MRSWDEVISPIEELSVADSAFVDAVSLRPSVETHLTGMHVQSDFRRHCIGDISDSGILRNRESTTQCGTLFMSKT